MTTLTCADLVRDRSTPGIEQVWTCDEHGNWWQEPRFRVREGNGWREIKVVTNPTTPNNGASAK